MEPAKTPETVVVDDTANQPKIEIKPRRSCVHCHGRGYCGTDVATGKKIVCRCVKRGYLKANLEENMKRAVKKVEDEEGLKLKPDQITSDMGWNRPKATPVNTTVVNTK